MPIDHRAPACAGVVRSLDHRQISSVSLSDALEALADTIRRAIVGVLAD